MSGFGCWVGSISVPALCIYVKVNYTQSCWKYVYVDSNVNFCYCSGKTNSGQKIVLSTLILSKCMLYASMINLLKCVLCTI
jgi:hypothetical protein